jgi:hypothetical protein
MISINLDFSASTATIVRLKYLTLYSDPNAFIYGTGKIGFWSLLEQGIGIIAGSLPALRPLLNLRIRVTTSSTTPTASRNTYPLSSNSRQAPPRKGGIMMDTFQTLNDKDDDDHSDGNSERKIVKETQYTVTTGMNRREHDLERDQVIGWEHQNTRGI